MTVQVLSLESYLNITTKSTFVSELRKSLTETGFVRVQDHDLDKNDLNRAYAITKQLFELPIEAKAKYKLKQLGLRGYTDFGQEKAKGQQSGDLKEFWHIGKSLNRESPYFERYPKNIWPEELPEFEPLFTQLFTQLENIALTLLKAIGEAFDVDPSYFPHLVKDGNSVLRLIHYPATRGFDTTKQMRAAPHADINLMTLLVGATDSGLQLLDKKGNWLGVETNPHEIVVDTGDMMERVTGGILPSTVHRVINPNNDNRERYSMPFFLHPHSDAVLEPRHEFASGSTKTPITAGEFLDQRLTENGLK